VCCPRTGQDREARKFEQWASTGPRKPGGLAHASPLCVRLIWKRLPGISAGCRDHSQEPSCRFNPYRNLAPDRDASAWPWKDLTGELSPLEPVDTRYAPFVSQAAKLIWFFVASVSMIVKRQAPAQTPVRCDHERIAAAPGASSSPFVV
jgi:hypothetical protein